MFQENSKQLLKIIKCYFRRTKQRRQLSSLNDFMLKDMAPQ